MKDATCLVENGASAIFYKDLAQDLVDVEFFCNNPCFVYIKNGRERITSLDNTSIEMSEGTVTFLPRGTNLHSDYVKSYQNLQAYLLFFDDDLIREFLSSQPHNGKRKHANTSPSHQDLHQFKGSSVLAGYFDSITNLKEINLFSTQLLKLKLLEFLNILALTNPVSNLDNLLLNIKPASPKRNIKRLISNPETLRLTVTDLAKLSDRSLSSFNRDFRESYNMPPQKWLRDKRLICAQKLLMEKDLSVTEVALEVGYENISHFIKTFKERFGLTPKEFKNTNCNKI
ncbi:helix-turn-helix domain-containing protein [Kiloniella antarctica]|uniref:Helix-turn-helix domain-containing protein n=1 Tax=Kiloniella antarctica TaxID=1550907 RepID=A0ABW5BJA5_9PROT